MIDDKYLRFTRDQMKEHFLIDDERQIDYFEKSAKRYRAFLAENPDTAGIPITVARLPRQIEKDERFWTSASLKYLFDNHSRISALESILSGAFGDKPPVNGLATWIECLTGELALYFEAQAPSPKVYTDWLRENIACRQFIPYILDAASRGNQRPLEGPTHFDAVIVNQSNGFSLMIEAKVISDISSYVSFDNLRNQIVRCIDVMLEKYPHLPKAFSARDPDRSLFLLLTPEVFFNNPHSRLYGWLLSEYRSKPEALKRDLPHRTSQAAEDWKNIASRLNWITFENIERHCPGACPWLGKMLPNSCMQADAGCRPRR